MFSLYFLPAEGREQRVFVRPTIKMHLLGTVLSKATWQFENDPLPAFDFRYVL